MPLLVHHLVKIETQLKTKKINTNLNITVQFLAPQSTVGGDIGENSDREESLAEERLYCSV